MAEQKMDDFKGQPRLPSFATPKRYDLKLKLDLSACKFTGSVAINLRITADTKIIVLNAADLSIENSSISFAALPWKQPSDVVLLQEDEILVLQFADSLLPGEGVLSMGFAGTLNDQMKGFYRSTYEHNGEKKNMAVTQFEPGDARWCFPCWDEPPLKAASKITLEVPCKLIALSNMPAVDEKLDKHLKIVSFQESPIMSTYLVDIVVGLFDYLEDLMPDVGMLKMGFYWVIYDEQLQAKLHNAIGAKSLSATDRYGILDDSSALSMACKQTSSLLSLVDAYREETNYAVLSHLITVSRKVASIAADAIPQSSHDIKQFFVNILQFTAAQVFQLFVYIEQLIHAASPSVRTRTVLHRGEILNVLIFLGDDVSKAEVARRFFAFLDDGSSSMLMPDIRKKNNNLQAAYVAEMQTVSTSNRSGYDCLLKVYRETDQSEEKGCILGS